MIYRYIGLCVSMLAFQAACGMIAEERAQIAAEQRIELKSLEKKLIPLLSCEDLRRYIFILDEDLFGYDSLSMLEKHLLFSKLFLLAAQDKDFGRSSSDNQAEKQMLCKRLDDLLSGPIGSLDARYKEVAIKIIEFNIVCLRQKYSMADTEAQYYGFLRPNDIALERYYKFQRCLSQKVCELYKDFFNALYDQCVPEFSAREKEKALEARERELRVIFNRNFDVCNDRHAKRLNIYENKIVPKTGFDKQLSRILGDMSADEHNVCFALLSHPYTSDYWITSALVVKLALCLPQHAMPFISTAVVTNIVEFMVIKHKCRDNGQKNRLGQFFKRFASLQEQPHSLHRGSN